MVTITTHGLGVCLGRRPVLHNVDATLAPGALIGVIGPNGAGKSTLVRALLGLVPAEGEVRIDGTPVAAIRRAELARRIA
ncbi:MAG: ATP-binding cassette domain-containing protein, partial [Sphingomonadaceae bacterium]